MNEINVNLIGIAHTLEQIKYAIECSATEQKEFSQTILNHLKYIGKEAESQTLILQRIEKLLTPASLTAEIKEDTNTTETLLSALLGAVLDIKDLMIMIEKLPKNKSWLTEYLALSEITNPVKVENRPIELKGK